MLTFVSCYGTYHNNLKLYSRNQTSHAKESIVFALGLMIVVLAHVSLCSSSEWVSFHELKARTARGMEEQHFHHQDSLDEKVSA